MVFVGRYVMNGLTSLLSLLSLLCHYTITIIINSIIIAITTTTTTTNAHYDQHIFVSGWQQTKTVSVLTIVVDRRWSTINFTNSRFSLYIINLY